MLDVEIIDCKPFLVVSGGGQLSLRPTPHAAVAQNFLYIIMFESTS